MDAASAKELAAALAVFVSLIEKLGPGGLIGLFVGGPSVMALFVFVQSAWSARRQHNLFEESRRTIYDLWDRHRDESARVQEAHRQETSLIVKELGAGVSKTTRYYEDNVELVKGYDKLSGNFQDLVATNIRSLEKVASGIEMLCKTMGQK